MHELPPTLSNWELDPCQDFFSCFRQNGGSAITSHTVCHYHASIHSIYRHLYSCRVVRFLGGVSDGHKAALEGKETKVSEETVIDVTSGRCSHHVTYHSCLLPVLFNNMHHVTYHSFVTLKILRYMYSVTLTLPEWATSSDYYERNYKTDEDRMSLAVELSRRNVAEGTGGPFGAAIFERNLETGETKLFSIGMNRVVPLNNSTLHGEMLAIQFAQQKLGTFSLSQKEGVEYDLYTSCEPCCMCLGGTLWSGVSTLVCSATKQDASSIGFDEGPVNADSYKHLEAAGIRVVKGVLQKEGAEVLRKYGETGVIYNR